MRRLLLAALLFGVLAPAAQADVHYTGTAVVRNTPRSPMFSFVVRDDGRIAGRVSFPYECRRVTNFNLIARTSGRADGAAFSMSGSTVLNRVRMRFTITGTLTPGGGTATVRLRVSGCKGYTRPALLRTESAPVGATAAPVPNTLMIGMTSQAAGGVRLPMFLRVTNKGRVYGAWSAWLDCGRGHITRVTATPSMKVKPDGTFSDNKGYTLHYKDGTSERMRIRFSGRIVADGAVGTLRAWATERGYKPCVSGPQTWAARP